MLAKITSKNQLTLPKAVVEAVGAVEYFDVTVSAGQIVLTPVRIQRGDAVRAKLAALGITQGDVADALRWARGSGAAGSLVRQPRAGYSVRKGVKAATKVKRPRRA